MYNYTDTIEKIYLNKNNSYTNEINIDIDFIHGKADKYFEIEKIIWFWELMNFFRLKIKMYILNL